MIKLLILLSLFIPLLGQEKLYRLPDHHSRFTYDLNHILKKSTHITISSPSFNHSALKKAVLQRARKGSSITFVVNNPKGDPLTMVQYERINLYVSSHPIHQTLFLIDDSLVCTLDGNFDEEELSSQHHLIRCSDDQHTIQTLKGSFIAILKHSKPYLE